MWAYLKKSFTNDMKLKKHPKQESIMHIRLSCLVFIQEENLFHSAPSRKSYHTEQKRLKYQLIRCEYTALLVTNKWSGCRACYTTCHIHHVLSAFTHQWMHRRTTNLQISRYYNCAIAAPKGFCLWR